MQGHLAAGSPPGPFPGSSRAASQPRKGQAPQPGPTPLPPLTARSGTLTPQRDSLATLSRREVSRDQRIKQSIQVFVGKCPATAKARPIFDIAKGRHGNPESQEEVTHQVEAGPALSDLLTASSRATSPLPPQGKLTAAMTRTQPPQARLHPSKNDSGDASRSMCGNSARTMSSAIRRAASLTPSFPTAIHSSGSRRQIAKPVIGHKTWTLTTCRTRSRALTSAAPPRVPLPKH